MNFSRYFKTSSYCLIGTGFVSVALTRTIHPAFIVLFAAAFFASWFMDTVRLRSIIPQWILNCYAIAYVPFFLWDARNLSHSFLVASIHFLILTASIKLLTLKKDRDYLQLYFISLAEILAASALTLHLIFGFCLLAFIIFGAGTAVLFEMLRSNAKMQASARVQPFVRSRRIQESGMELFSQFPAGLFFLSTIGMALLILTAAIPLFLFMPRVTIGFIPRPPGSTQFISGFSNRVELGRIGTIQQSNAIVMRIQTSSGASGLPENLKWRGLSFDYFDGRCWRNADTNTRSIPTQGRYYKLEDSAQGRDWLNQTFYVEALSTNVIFAANRPLAISIDAGELRRDSAGNLFSEAHILRKLRYTVISDPIRPDPSHMSDLLPIPQEILSRYLQVPPEDPRILDLARRVTQRASDRFSKAMELEQYLRSNYKYSLILRGTPSNRDPVAMFLFDVRSGHCEYFASSMAIMLRQLGIPSRLVNGFRTGEYNDIGGNWTVRQHHAHSWVEAYFPPYGWIEFDPTPTDPGQPKTGFARLISDLTDAVDLWWWEGVLNYDSSKQYKARSVVQSAFEKGWQGIAGLFARIHEQAGAHISFARVRHLVAVYKIWIACLALMLLTVLILARRWWGRISGKIQRAWHRDSSKSIAFSYFAEALRLLRSRGHKLKRGQTALEFANSLHDTPHGDPFLALTLMYYSIRFGSSHQTFDRAEAQIQLRLLRNSIGKQ